MQVFRVLRPRWAVTALGVVMAVVPAGLTTPAVGAVGKSVAQALQQPQRSPDSGHALHHDTSPALRYLAQQPVQLPSTPPPGDFGQPPLPASTERAAPDPVVQDFNGYRPQIQPRRNFEGISNGGTHPPDPNASVGLHQIVETTNTELAVYSKAGDTLLRPVPIDALWRGFGGVCEKGQSDGKGTKVDPVVRWDTLARRWITTWYAFERHQLCVAVSTSEDATGSYYRYAFGYQKDNPDYPKLAVWPDAYYVTVNAAGSTGAEACAWDRSRMLRGADADQQCYVMWTPRIMLPSDLDNTTRPPLGEPNLLVTMSDMDNSLVYWHFHVDWADQRRTLVSSPQELPVEPFTRACESTPGGNECVPQADTAQKLDSLSYFPMYRLAYRNFGDHESVVFNHAVRVPGAVGVRWYELRLLPDGRPAVQQQSTYAPDTTYRWMGSAAMNREGDIALGYSQSSSQDHPSIRITGRLAEDPPNLMTFQETTVFTGRGSQTGPGDQPARWGDYTSMAVDPADDCTFWYTNEYQPYTFPDNLNAWHTRIAAFQLRDCGQGP